MQQKVILLGPGNVGKEFIRQVLKYDSVSVGKHNNPTLIMGVATSKELLFSPFGLKDEQLEYIVNNGKLGSSSISIDTPSRILDFVDNAGLNGEIIFIDATGAKESMRDFHLEIIEKSDNYVVTANKNPISLYDFEIYKRLTKNLRYQYTTCVMAGSGIIRFLRGTRKISDKIHKFYGVFSGTLGFICGELDKGKKISDIVNEAYKLGYTEPHPWDDLNGIDVARKLVILGRSAGYKININDIKISPFIGDKYGKILDIKKFLEEIKNENEIFKDKVSKAHKKGNVLRYIASFEEQGKSIEVSVGLKEVSKDSPIGRLSGPANFVEVITDLYGSSSSYILQTPGAGLKITAGSLRKDMLSFLPKLNTIRDEKYKYK